MATKITREMIIRHMTLNGFAYAEARKIAYAKVNQNDRHSLQEPDVLWHSGLIQKAIRSRRAYIQNCRNSGWSEDQIKKSIRMFYKGHEKDGDVEFFKWLKIEYEIPSAHLTNYALSVHLRARDRINRVARIMGVRYGKSTPKKYKIKPELFVKQPEDRFLGNP
jgi:hypothetical protein